MGFRCLFALGGLLVVAAVGCKKEATEVAKTVDAAPVAIADPVVKPWWKEGTPCPETATLKETEEGRGYQCVLEDGTPHGRVVSLNQKLTKRTEGSYVKGKRDGIWSQWNEEGELLGTFSMIAGSGTVYEWFDSGDPRLEIIFKDGKRSGPYREWHEGRKLRWQRAYDKGLPIGGWQQWSRDGKLLGSLTFKAGSGRFVEWDDDGNESVAGVFRKGKQHGKWKWKWSTSSDDGPIPVEYRRSYRDGKVVSLRVFRNGKEIRDGKEAQALVALAPKKKEGPVLLGVLGGGPSVFANALGDDELSALGGLTGDSIGGSFGSAGLGLSGTGRGGGGGMGAQGRVGMGTTGLGGSPRVKPKVTGSVRIGSPTVSGALAKEIIRRVLRRSTGRLRLCYQKGMMGDPTLKGKVTVSMTIGSNGNVASAKATGLGNKSVEDCFARTLRSAIFPKPKSGGVVIAKVPFTLSL